MRQTPFVAILLRRQIVMGSQMALQRFELFAILEADDVFGRDGFLHGDGRPQLLPRGNARGTRGFAQRVEDIVDDTGKIGGNDRIVADLSRHDLGGQLDEFILLQIGFHIEAP